MKPHGFAALLADLAIHLVVVCVVVFLVFGILRAAHSMGAIEHQLVAKITRAGPGS